MCDSMSRKEFLVSLYYAGYTTEIGHFSIDLNEYSTTIVIVLKNQNKPSKTKI